MDKGSVTSNTIKKLRTNKIDNSKKNCKWKSQMEEASKLAEGKLKRQVYMKPIFSTNNNQLHKRQKCDAIRCNNFKIM